RRRLMLLTQLGIAATTLLLLVNALLPEPRVWALFVLGFMGASFFCLGIGGMPSVVPRLVPEDTIVLAAGHPTPSGSFHQFPALAATFGSAALASVPARVTIAQLPRIAPVPDADRPSVSSILDGFRYVKTQPVVLGFMLVDINAMVFGMPMALFPAIATHR